MLKNYIKIAIRNIRRNKIYSTISVLGLAIGITGATLLYLYINDELSYDSFHEKSDRIYRIVEISPDGSRKFGQTAPVLGATLEESYPEIQEMVRLYQPGGHIDMLWEGERIHERNYVLADPGFFQLFDFKIVKGDAENPLAIPNSVVISERTAERLFGDENPIGQDLPLNNIHPVIVTAVVENVSGNSHIQFDYAISSENTGLDREEYLNDWSVHGAYTYLLLEPSTDLNQFKTKMDSFTQTQKETNSEARDFYLQSLEEIYFGSADIEFGLEQSHGNIFYISIFSAIGLFLLLIAGINYMNLATALSARRGREIGIRKAAGAERQQLVFQFLSESVVIALLACIISYFFIELSLPFFNDLTGKQFMLNGETALPILGILFGIGLTLGILSGSYPAFYLALIQPIRVLKSKTNLKGNNLALRKVLVVTQFALSIVLIIGTLVIYKQMNYLQDADLGFDKEQVLVVDINHGNVRARFETMKQELETIPGVISAATSSYVPGGSWISHAFSRSAESSSEDYQQMNFMSVDEDLLDLYDLEFVSGSNFTGNRGVDSLSVLINETAAEALSLDNPVGSFFDIDGVNDPVKIIGVLKNFNYQSMHQKIAPLIVGYWTNPIRNIDFFSIKVTGSNLQGTVEQIKGVHEQFDPVTAMEYRFLDEQIDQSYQAEIRAGRLFGIGAGVTIFIACMGLFGLALLATETRIREIGIRKVLGASIPDILTLLTTDFVKLVAVAFIISIPVGWLVMNSWLNNFAYHTNLGASVFLGAGVLALLLSILTISWQAVQAALTNPVESLKNE